MIPRRLTLAIATVIVIVAMSLMYEPATPLPPGPTPTPGTNCEYYPVQRGLGWEPWVLEAWCE